MNGKGFSSGTKLGSVYKQMRGSCPLQVCIFSSVVNIRSVLGGLVSPSRGNSLFQLYLVI